MLFRSSRILIRVQFPESYLAFVILSEPIDDRGDQTTGPAPRGPAVHKYQRVFGNERVEARVVYFYGRVRRISHNDLRTTSLPVRYMPDSERMCRASDFYPSRKILQVHLSLQPHPFQSRGSEDSKHSPVFLGIFLWSSGLSPHSKRISDPWRCL